MFLKEYKNTSYDANVIVAGILLISRLISRMLRRHKDIELLM